MSSRYDSGSPAPSSSTSRERTPNHNYSSSPEATADRLRAALSSNKTALNALRNSIKGLVNRSRGATTFPRFLELAGEMRTAIYEELLELRPSAEDPSRMVCYPEILATSGQVNNEAKDLIYHENINQFDIQVTSRGHSCFKSNKSSIGILGRSYWEERVYTPTLGNVFYAWPSFLCKARRIHIDLELEAPHSRWCMDAVYGTERHARANHIIYSLISFLCSSALDRSATLEITFSGSDSDSSMGLDLDLLKDPTSIMFLRGFAKPTIDLVRNSFQIGKREGDIAWIFGNLPQLKRMIVASDKMIRPFKSATAANVPPFVLQLELALLEIRIFLTSKTTCVAHNDHFNFVHSATRLDRLLNSRRAEPFRITGRKEVHPRALGLGPDFWEAFSVNTEDEDNSDGANSGDVGSEIDSEGQDIWTGYHGSARHLSSAAAVATAMSRTRRPWSM